jgi:hypothetical protein
MCQIKQSDIGNRMSRRLPGAVTVWVDLERPEQSFRATQPDE